MRAMILAAGLGTRMHPLTTLRAKPALPVRGQPVIATLLALLARHGVREVMINLHHRPESIVEAVERFGPPGLRVEYSREPVPLGTGGGIRRVREFLAESDPAIVIGGDMLLDVDLTAIAATHRQRRAHCTLLLRRDPRAEQFGTIGIDDRGRVRRIARRFDLGGETRSGVFLGVRLFSPGAFGSLPTRAGTPTPPGVTHRAPEFAQNEPFEDLSDWLAPALRAGSERILGHLLEPEEVVWEPVGTPSEYLAANLSPPALSYLPSLFASPEFLPEGTKGMGRSADVVLGEGAAIGRDVKLERCVVWEGEQVPDGARAHGGVIAAGRFYACEAEGSASGVECEDGRGAKDDRGPDSQHDQHGE